MYHRFTAEQVVTALSDTRVVLISGPRQAGKTTLARAVAGAGWTYLNLDDAVTLEAARTDPVGFVRDLDRAVIDEVQRAPELLLSIKHSVDEDSRPGRFILTGSANIMTIPQVADSLAGRMEVLRLYPLSRSEVIGHRPRFLDSLFSQQIPAAREAAVGTALIDMVLKGGFPEAIGRANESRRRTWLSSYSDAIVKRDVRDIASAHKLDEMPKLLRILAEHSGQLTNFNEMGSKIGLDSKTVQRYVGILEQIFVVHRIEPWFTNRLKRISKSPKLHFIDSGLLAAVRGVSAASIRNDRRLLGPLLETFVVSEILKQASWSEERRLVMHFRDRDKDEVDIVVENEAGEIVGIEVKASATVIADDFKGMKVLQSVLGKKFKAGVVLYDGSRAVPFGANRWAVPMPCLWS